MTFKCVSLRDPSRGLAWSNSGITDEVLIRKSLATGGFTVILQACLDFGMNRVHAQWAIVCRDPELTNPTLRALVGDILENIAQGFANARANLVQL